MARAARYGNIQPDVFGTLDIAEALELADRVQVLHVQEQEELDKAANARTKALMEQIANRRLF